MVALLGVLVMALGLAGFRMSLGVPFLLSCSATCLLCSETGFLFVLLGTFGERLDVSWRLVVLGPPSRWHGRVTGRRLGRAVR